MKFSMMPSTGSRNAKLGFPNAARQFDLKKDRVCFWGYADVKEISFFISTDVLRHFNPEMTANEVTILETFDTARDQIQKAASKKFSRKGDSSGAYTLIGKDFL